MKIVVLDGFTLNPGDLNWDELASMGDFTVYDRTPRELVVERASDAEVIFTNKTIITDADMAQLPKLRYIGIFATGYNVVDVNAAGRRSIVVTNIPAYSTDSVAQHIFALLLTITNHVEHYASENRKGRWTESPDFAYTDFPLIELAGKNFGIVGYGHIGKAVARIAQAFCMNVLAFSSKPQGELGNVSKVDIDKLFEESDVVAMCCPLTDKNKGMVNAHLLSLMKPSAIFINTARGGLVDEDALAEALRNGKIYAAGLDVLSSEPPKADNPLLSIPNCYVTPHIAWASHEARTRCMAVAIANLRAFLSGHPQNVVS